LNALSESGQYAKQSPNCTPPASPVQPPPAEPSKEKILHASDAEGIKAEGQAAAMAAIAAAQAQVNGQGRFSKASCIITKRNECAHIVAG